MNYSYNYLGRMLFFLIIICIAVTCYFLVNFKDSFRKVVYSCDKLGCYESWDISNINTDKDLLLWPITKRSPLDVKTVKYKFISFYYIEGENICDCSDKCSDKPVVKKKREFENIKYLTQQSAMKDIQILQSGESAKIEHYNVEAILLAFLKLATWLLVMVFIIIKPIYCKYKKDYDDINEVWGIDTKDL